MLDRMASVTLACRAVSPGAPAPATTAAATSSRSSTSSWAAASSRASGMPSRVMQRRRMVAGARLEREVGSRVGRAFEEQPLGVGERGIEHGRQRDDALPRDLEGLAARHDDREPLRAAEHAAHELTGRVEHVLGVVEHEQRPASTESAGDRRDRGLRGAEQFADGRRDAGPVRDGGEVDHPLLLVDRAGRATGALDHEAGLADTARADDGDQACRGACAARAPRGRVRARRTA